MLIIDEETGNQTVRQGDSYKFEVEGVDDSYTMYYSVYNSSREIIFEIMATPQQGVTTFEVTSADSNKLTVPVNKKSETYYYGLKRCKNGYEDTLVVGNKSVSDLNKVLVYPLTTEGSVNDNS